LFEKEKPEQFISEIDSKEVLFPRFEVEKIVADLKQDGNKIWNCKSE
jgi:hypothetical protein